MANNLCTEESIKVLVRVRPIDNNLNEYLEIKDKSICIPEKPRSALHEPNLDKSRSYILDTCEKSREFIFDYVQNGSSSQETIFRNCQGIFNSFINGYNATIFAYGQTGSGKTFTMSGKYNLNGQTDEPGIIPRGLHFIFQTLNENYIKNKCEFLLKCSFVEIYNENVFDLLSKNEQKVNVKINIEQEVFLEPLNEYIVNTPGEALNIYRLGLQNRHVADTALNRESSRSHAVFTIKLESKERNDEVDNIKRSVLHLVDLAGSERQKDAQTVGARLKEACMINTSLLTLGNVIRNLVEVSKGKRHTIAYRQSKLTLMLKDALGGNSKTLLIACIHPSSNYFQETMSTLYFADRAKMIKNKAKINVDVLGVDENLRTEITKLRQQLEDYRIFPSLNHSDLNTESKWKTKFISSMILYCCNINQSKQLEEKIEILQNNNSYLESIVKTLKTCANMKRLIDELPSSDIDAAVTEKIKQLSDMANTNNTHNSQMIKYGLLQSEMNHLKGKLKQMNMISHISDKALLNDLFYHYNNAISDEEFCNNVKKYGFHNVESMKLQDEVNKLKSYMIYLKSKSKNNKITYDYERNRLIKEISNLRDKQRSDHYRVTEQSRRLSRAFTLSGGTITDASRTQYQRRPLLEINDQENVCGVDLNTSDDIFNTSATFAHNISMKDELDVCKTTIKNLEEQLKDYEKLKINYKNLKHDHVEHDSKLKEYEMTIKHLEMEKSELKAAKEKSMFALNEELEDLRSVVTEMERDQSTIKEENEILRQEKSFMSDKQKHLEIEMDSMKKNIEQSGNQKSNKNKKSISNLTHQIDQYKLENEQLQIKLSQLKIKNQELDQNMSKYYLENHQLSSDLYDIKIQNTNLHEELNLMDVKYNQLDKNMHDESVQHQTLIDQMQFAHEKTIDKVNQQHTVQLHTLKEQIDLLNCQIELINQKTVDTKDTQTLPADEFFDENEVLNKEITVEQNLECVSKANKDLWQHVSELNDQLDNEKSKYHDIKCFTDHLRENYMITYDKSDLECLEYLQNKVELLNQDLESTLDAKMELESEQQKFKNIPKLVKDIRIYFKNFHDFQNLNEIEILIHLFEEYQRLNERHTKHLEILTRLNNVQKETANERDLLKNAYQKLMEEFKKRVADIETILLWLHSKNMTRQFYDEEVVKIEDF